MTTEHRPPCVDGSVCGESAHCPPADDPTTTPEALDALAEVIFTGWTGFNYKPWKGPNDARDEDWQSALSAASAVLRYRPDCPSDLAAEVARLREGIETLDLDVLEDVAFNLGHTVYEATELEPAECMDECEACCIEDTVAGLRALLAGAR